MIVHTLNRICAAEVKNAEPGKHSVGGGLWLVKHQTVRAQWAFLGSEHR